MRHSIACVLISVLAWSGVEASEFSLRMIPDVAMAPAVTSNAAVFASAWSDEEIDNTKPLSAKRAIAYSLVLPGWGDYYAGQRGRANMFFLAEAAIWTSFAVFRVQGSQREDAYEEFAVRFAHVQNTEHSDDFYATLREHESDAAYEASLKEEGRFELFPNVGYDALENYYLEERVADFEPWQWDSLERRVQYSEMRSSSKTSYRRSEYMIAIAAANRVVSAIFAYSAVRAANRVENTQSGRYHIDIDTPLGLGSAYDAVVTVTRSF